MEELKQVLTQTDTVLFIGSGVSLWAGLPTWSGMIEELAQFVERHGMKADLIRAEAKRGDLLQAASYGFDKLTKQQIGTFIRAASRYGKAHPHAIHEKIVSLGPRCFITTNYDDLIEQSLRKWQPDRFYRPPITNRQLTETGGIVHARAIDFIFKPHGDAADSESIILTREQYRKLLPQGEQHYALDSLKTLLVSRPMVYIGFGLRDPDFIYIRDLLTNTYKGATRDHYAIMADVSEPEVDYWRRHYGIHLVNYATTELPDKTRDHSALSTLLDNLLEPTPAVKAPPAFNPKAPEILLALARYAAALGRTPQMTPELPIRVTAEMRRGNGLWHERNRFDHCPVETFLDSGPERAVLVGLPGAGKTYALRRSAARIAEKLHEVCLSDSYNESDIIIPVLVDLKLYRGNLAELANQTLPPSVPLDEVTRCFKSKIFLDSFNEMPREYWESGSYETDFANFIANFDRASLIIGSRTNDGLVKFGLPVYCLDEIDDDVVASELQRMGIEIAGRFSNEIRQLLQKPYYFQLITKGIVGIPKEAHPRDFYRSLFEKLHQAFALRFGHSFKIEEALSAAAYDAIDRGEEAFPLSDMLRVLRINIEAENYSDVEASDVANWLVSRSILTPYSGARVSFVHQSVTEYLAAKELARRYQQSPHILREKLVLTRWDQALFLALSLLPQSESEAFFNEVVGVDFALALSAAKYLEVGRDAIVSKLLSRIPEHLKRFGPFESRIEWILESSLPISEIHESYLRDLMRLGDMIGAAAVTRLIELKGADVKEELLHAMVEARSDYNYCCNGIAKALQPLATRDDIPLVLALAESISEEVKPDSHDDVAGGFISGAVTFLSQLELSIIHEGFLLIGKSRPMSEICARILCEILWDRHSTSALEIAGEMLLCGVSRAATAISFIVRYGEHEKELSWTTFSAKHVNRLISIADEPEDKSWSLRALQHVCAGRPDLAKVVEEKARDRSGIAKAAFLYCSNPTNYVPVFESLGELVKMSEARRREEPIHLLEQIDLNWAGQEKLFIDLLKLRDSQLALAILSYQYDAHDRTLGQLEIGQIEWWLDWLADESSYFFRDSLSYIFSSYVSEEARNSFVAEFNKANSKYREVLADTVLLVRTDLSTDDFSAEAISFVLANLSRSNRGISWRGTIFGNTATERFVTERLLPLLSETSSPFKENLRIVLRQAGKRHGRRYFPE